MRQALLILVAVLFAGPARSGTDLFSCRVIVTGTERRQHPDAWERCLRAAIVKATGRPSLGDDPRLGPIVQAAPALTETFIYLDRMSDMPRHDEQGTRDRPYDLIVQFRAEALTRLLERAGLHVWRARPALDISVTVEPPRGAAFTVTAEQDQSERHRRALLAAGERFGMRVAIPSADQASAAGRGVGLSGRLVWSEADFGWNADWQLGQAEWSVRGVSFDEAYRVGIGGAAERLASR